ncbi:sensor domain-containing diguanylate cyclase [Vibrio sinaloensis]|uniref:sensor domain-containing diguanylate cyclase n=1 Tax=Photobacterium sp. (strain ATCC 43367) TaxID=379097 RepID=UPI0035EA62EE
MIIESDSEKVIRGLYQITNDYSKGFEIQISQLLMMGLERFDLDIAILSRIEGKKYTVLHCVTPEGAVLNPGDEFDFESTYCQITCSSFGPVAIENMGEDDLYAKHPAYQAFGLESYIGIPIFVDDEVFGTLNFSSATPYPRHFAKMDIDVLKLMASWIEVELIRREQEKKLQQLNARLEYQAHHDPLTEVANRRSLFKTIHLSLEEMKKSGGKGSLLVIDLDKFKHVNDTYGHQIGDDVLKKSARLLKKQLTGDDFIARFGGEEFVIWLPEGDVSARRECVEKIHRSVNEIKLDGHPVTVSIGVCEFDFAEPFENQCKKSMLDHILALADRSLYQAKVQGRDKVIYSQLKSAVCQ